MPSRVTYIPSSDDDDDISRGSNSISTSKSAGKRRGSKSLAPTQGKRRKTGTVKDQAKPASKKSQKPVTALSLEAQSAKNTASRLSTLEKRQAAPAKQELAASIERIKKSASPAYATFELPKLVKPRAKDAPYEYQGFVCKTCRERILRRIGSSETSSLLKHQNRCELRKHQGLLSEYGITGGGGPPSVYDFRQYVVQWVSEDGRAFATVYDRYFRKLFPVEIMRMLPSRATLVKDISTLYRMAQNVIKRMLADIPGVFHIGLDMYQAPNGYDYLGVVIFHPLVKDNTMHMKRFVLECLSFAGRHTGVALANTVYAILCRFQIQDRVWGVVCDNASNNADMMNRFKKFKMKRLIGPEARVHCLPHVLNLASKAIAAPFLKERAQLEKRPAINRGDELDDLSLSDDGKDVDDDDDDARSQGTGSVIEDFDPNEEDETGEDDGTAPSRALDEDEDEYDEEMSDVIIPDLIAGSLDAKELKVARKALYKIAWLARKLRFSPQFRQLFRETCEELDAPTPHNIQRDVVTRWNSTQCMLEGAVRLEGAILQFQKSPDFPVEKRLTKKDLTAMKVLLRLLKPLSTLTEIMSRSNVPMLADVLVHYDSLNHEYCTMALDKNLPLWGQQGANRARLKLDKHYHITDSSHLYRLGILFHPSNRVAYLKRLGWKPEWIAQAAQIATDTWATHYKPEDYENGEDDTSSHSQFGYTSFADEVYGSFAEEEDKPTDPVTHFIEGKPVIERTNSGKSKPVNPVNWWYAQRLAGEEHHGLTQMALDVLTTPASSVDVERAFSFVSHLVSKRRHSMAAYTVQSTATLGAYSRADLVPTGLLAKAHQKARERTQANARAKVADAKAKAAAAEAEALAAEQEQSEEGGSEDEATDDEDVLQPSSEVEDVDLEDDG
ncbi:hAT family dimerization protein [Rhizoctonia solani AG-3 Rhs1AP]|uniref:HAT family dimerization protein n=2 Tax=Rhizoctonia solani AG-3 TaxID=1086053 RepID=A0A074RXK7_9AGAM|nr:hAT family dimerization protein [Rhizoctonia solani AG-3 Rhs1AP]KEP49358.1 hAT family dimerization protein [Rhizoctonia solani 123E]